MSFLSVQFPVFLVVVFLAYFLTPRRFQWIVLLIASYVFYLFSGVAMTVLLLGTTLITFYTGLLLGRSNQRYNAVIASSTGNLTVEQKSALRDRRNREKKLTLTAALLLIFGILAFMKYSGFLAANLNAVLGLFTSSRLRVLNLLLPLGISFYTFQSAAYLIDINRGKIEPDRNLAKFALFVSFFPQIVQGPISRYDQLAAQLYEGHSFDYTRAKFGLQLILWGLFKKLVIADRAAVIVSTVFKNYWQYEGFTTFAAALFYCIQIYGDFSGGIDIARGVAQIMGISLPQNFNHPFFAVSLPDFWRRWHISLSNWMRDYIFYPLSLSKSFTRLGRGARKLLGNRVGRLVPPFLATILTFLAVGIWHGANWKFVAYGFYNGIFIFLETFIHPLRDRLQKKYNLNFETFGWRFWQVLTTLVVVGFGRYFSRAANLRIAGKMFAKTFESFNPWVFFDGTFLNLGLDQKNLILLLVAIGVLLAVEAFQESSLQIRQKLSEQNLAFRWLVYLVLLFTVIIFGVYGMEYNAASFIYRGI